MFCGPLDTLSSLQKSHLWIKEAVSLGIWLLCKLGVKVSINRGKEGYIINNFGILQAFVWTGDSNHKYLQLRIGFRKYLTPQNQ